MNSKELNELRDSIRKEQDDLFISKGHDYTLANEDRLWNFKQVAELTGITPLQAWSVYWLKHVFAVLTYVKHGSVKSEEIKGRFVDIGNYNYLGMGLIEEIENEIKQRDCDNFGVKPQEVPTYKESEGSTDEQGVPFVSPAEPRSVVQPDTRPFVRSRMFKHSDNM